jgi:hypothetical protein
MSRDKCGKCEREQVRTRVKIEKRKRDRQLGRMTLKWEHYIRLMLYDWDESRGTSLMWWDEAQVAASCKQELEYSVSIKGRNVRIT